MKIEMFAIVIYLFIQLLFVVVKLTGFSQFNWTLIFIPTYAFIVLCLLAFIHALTALDKMEDETEF